MGKTVAELEATLGSSELNEWLLFWQREPWGPRRDNIHAAIIASILTNAFRSEKSKAVTYEDFMLVDRDEHRQKKTQEFLGWLKTVGQKKNVKR